MDLISALKRKNILVIGDVMLDMYCQGSINRISPEAPVPVFRKKAERYVLGGAANVATNIVAANQNVYMMTIVGCDINGDIILNLLQKEGIDTNMCVKTERRTTVKTRFVANNNQQVLRLDEEDTYPLNEDECEHCLSLLEANIHQFDLIVLSDYLKGVLSYSFTQSIINLAKQKGIKVVIDVKDPCADKYRGCYLLKPNLLELKMLTGMGVETDEEIVKASRILREKVDCEYVLTTCGSRGMILIGENSVFEVKSVGKEVYDVTGAGDTTIAYLATCIVNDIEISQSVVVSNYAAGVQVAKLGTSKVFLEEVMEYMNAGKQGIVQKLIGQDAVKRFRETHAEKKIVFTNGCFDILHVGHIRYLQEAAKLGDILVVGINSDASVKRLKGESRPINQEHDRAELMCALGYVDYVVIFEEDTPYELIKMIQPDVLVKGADYKPEDVVGKDIVEARGGKVELISFVEGKSTTNIINKIK